MTTTAVETYIDSTVVAATRRAHSFNSSILSWASSIDQRVRGGQSARRARGNGSSRSAQLHQGTPRGLEGTDPLPWNLLLKLVSWQDMRDYMPAPHRRFLEHVSSVANIRDYVEAHQWDRPLCIAYDACLVMLRAFRDKHIQMVSRYIIIKSRESRMQSQPFSPTLTPASADSNITTTPQSTPVNAEVARERKNLKGTGGTALIPFLKQARDETGEPAIDTWARRILGNAPAKVGSTFAAATRPGDGFLDGSSFGGRQQEQQQLKTRTNLEIVGLAGTWTTDDSEGGLCHW